jgi:predicted metal-binding protein
MPTSSREELEALFQQHGCANFKWMEAQQIMVSYWVRMKCTFGCDTYGQKASCPPNTPSVEDCRAFISEYRTAAIFHFSAALPERDSREQWLRGINAKMLKLERAVFLAGYQKAFAMPAATCRLCADCQDSRCDCTHLDASRPAPEAMAIDVFGTARRMGYPIQVLTDVAQEMNRYAILLLE